MKLFATSLFALQGLFTVVSALGSLDGNTCREGEQQCTLNQVINQCVKSKWAIVNVCGPGDTCIENPTPLCVRNAVQHGTVNAEQDTPAVTGFGNDVAESSVTEDCRNGDAKCEVLPRILLGRHAIKRCNDHKWITAEVCDSEDVCNVDPSPHCVGQAVEAHDEVTDEDTDKDAVEVEQANKVELPCSKCKKFRDQCTVDCCKRTRWRTIPYCRKECINKMKNFLVEDGQHGRYRGTCQYYCPQLCTAA